MQSRMVNLILVALNIAFLGVIALLVLLLKEKQGPPRFLHTPHPVTNTVTQIAVRKVNATNLLALLASRQVSWANIESTNYFVYVNNLRTFGVPEETVRDIVVADVHKFFVQRRGAIRAQMPRPPFWQTGSAWEESAEASLTPELRAQMRALEQEEYELLKQLLGIDPRAELARFTDGDATEADRKYDFLPAEKRDRLTAVVERYDEMEQAVYSRTKGLVLDEDQEQLRQIAQAREAALAQVLSPEELEEYQLRHSSTAQALRYSLDGFSPNEEEFRKIFRIQKSFDAQFGDAFDSTDEKQMEVRALAQQEAQQALNEEIKKTVGEQRYKEYERAQDEDYKMLLQVAGRFDLPPETASRVYDMKLAAEKQREAVELSPNYTEEQRAAALQAIARETEKSIAQVMGDKVFKTYRKAGGQWLNELGVSVLPETPPAPQTEAVPVPVAPPGFPPLPPGVFPPVPGELPR
jgi:hypothetical protein